MINKNIFLTLFLYIILPITLIAILITIIMILKNQKLTSIKKGTLLLKVLGIVFAIYSGYTLIWSICELIPLRKYNVLEESKFPIFLWIILPIFPFLVTYILWSKYKTIKEIGDNNE
jgi:hypothetical protein